MNNIARIFRDDCRRLFANVVSVIIAAGLVVMPSIFAWYNVIACWNVFDNTGNLTVAVANADEGYQSDLVPLRVNVGEQVVSALRANDQIDWVITTEDDAVDGARSGRYYAAVVIPPEFSRDMLTFYAEDSEHAKIIYYANEKKSAIAPKITDRGADTVSYQVNEVFAETLSEVALGVAESFSRLADEGNLDGRVADVADHARSLADSAERASSVLGLYSSLAQTARDLVDGSAALAASARAGIDGASDAAGQGIAAARTAANALRSSGAGLSDALAASSAAFDAAAGSVDGVFDAMSGSTATSAAHLRERAQALDAQVGAYRDLAAHLRELAAGAPEAEQAALEHAAQGMDAVADLVVSMQGNLRSAADKLEAGDAAAQADREAARQQAAEARDRIDALKADFDEHLGPELDQLAADSATLADGLETALGKLDAAGGELAASAGSAGESLDAASAKIDEAAAGLAGAASQLREMADAVDAALAAGDPQALRDVLNADAQALSSALAAPVAVERVAVFPAENFGSAMAPLYTTLALFIGSLLILVVVKPTVSARDQADLRDPKPRQLFLGRFGVMALLSLAQTTLMGLGNLFFLQVQAAHPWLLMLCFWTAGLVFTFLIYALVAAFANLGKAMAVLLLIVQVTGCGGSFPLQLLPGFVQALSPWLPATHVVNAMRAAMMGTYGTDYWVQMGQLMLFVVPAALIGLVLRRPLARFMAWYVEQVESSKLVG
ncbi:YhgE/Pip domain-containing protein [Enterorhabdus sp. P55]|uniref:YhgE/Pip domain-containing protein n=1 Tax=Enterorhabdus sp. P55 TaxID=2304571 RepID=UPI0013694704|nr:YhgE/Pip domain-containing protein [Enterorhabdus sp. P55]